MTIKQHVEHVTLVGNTVRIDQGHWTGYTFTLPTHEPIDLRTGMTPDEYWRSFGLRLVSDGES